MNVRKNKLCEVCQSQQQLQTCAQSHGKTVIFIENETVDSFGPHMIELHCHWKPPFGLLTIFNTMSFLCVNV